MRNSCDVVLSDMMSNTTGNKQLDAESSLQLVLKALELSMILLKTSNVVDPVLKVVNDHQLAESLKDKKIPTTNVSNSKKKHGFLVVKIFMGGNFEHLYKLVYIFVPILFNSR